MKRTFWLGALCALALAGCSDLKEPATQAVSAAEASLAPLKEAADQYAPDALRSVESKIVTLKNDLATTDYKSVMAAVPAVTAAISNLRETVAAKKAEIEAATNDQGPK